MRTEATTAGTPEVVEPAPTPAASEPPAAEVKHEQIELREKVQFETNSAVLVESSKTLLDEVATIMTDHPELTKIRIEGHTDSTATPDHNRRLSDQRARAVKTYLVGKGVAEGRLIARGFGMTKPIADNDTDDGRSTNRRVELHIVERAK